jgi:hypothetical protein
LREQLYAHFDRFRTSHPWVGSENVRPKSVARDLYERSLTFREYVNEYGIKRSEGLLLRYLSDAYKALVQMVPEDAKSPAVLEVTEWLGTVVRHVDASLIEEWERLRSGEPPTDRRPLEDDLFHPPDVTANRRTFRILVANEVFRWVRHLARREEDRLRDALDEATVEGAAAGWTTEQLRAAMAPYWEEHPSLGTGPDARSPHLLRVLDETPTQWRIRQALADPEQWFEWGITASVDLAASRAEGRPVLHLDEISRTT